MTNLVRYDLKTIKPENEQGMKEELVLEAKVAQEFQHELHKEGFEEKAVSLAEQMLPKLIQLLEGLEERREEVEVLQDKLLENENALEEYLIQKLLGFFEENELKQIFDTLDHVAQEEERNVQKEIRNKRRLLRGRHPRGHVYKRLMNTVDDNVQHFNKMRQIVLNQIDKQQELIEQIKEKEKLLPESQKEVKKLINELLDSFTLEAETIYEIDWDIDEEEALFLETIRFHVASLRELAKQGKVDIKDLLQKYEKLQKAYDGIYVVRDAKGLQKEKSHTEKIKGAIKNGWAKYKEYLNSPGGRLSMYVAMGPLGALIWLLKDKERREQLIEASPEIAEGVVFLLEGDYKQALKSLPAIVKVIINDPQIPEKEKAALNKFVESKGGKYLMEKAQDKAVAKLEQKS